MNENQLRITSNQNWSAAGSAGTNRQDGLGLFYLVYDLTFEIHYVNQITYEADKIDDIIQNEVDFVSTRLNAGNDHAQTMTPKIVPPCRMKIGPRTWRNSSIGRT